MSDLIQVSVRFGMSVVMVIELKERIDFVCKTKNNEQA